MPSKNNKIKNVVIINDFDYVQGGASKIAIDTANLLVTNYNVYFVSAVTSNYNELDNRVHKINSNQKEALKGKLKGIFYGIYNLKAKQKLGQLLDTLTPDDTIIHVHGWTKALSSSIFDVCFDKKFKVVITMHDYFISCLNGGYFNYQNNSVCNYKPLSLKCVMCNCDSRNYLFKIYRIVRQFVQNKIVKLDKKVKYCITISEFSEQILKKQLSNVKFYKLYNPISINDISTQIKKDYFIFVGRVSQEKGADIFCKAVKDSNTKGIVVGDGPLLKELKNNYKNIEFVGWKNQSDMSKYLKSAIALIFPSRWYETMGLTVVEAHKLGVPTIVYKNCAASEFVSENNGIIYSSYDELVSILHNFKFNKSVKMKMNLSVDNYIDGLIKIYKDIKEDEK